MSTKTEQWCDEMERLRAEATPGEWEWDYIALNSVEITDGEGQLVVEVISNDGNICAYKGEGLRHIANFDYIVSIHNAQEALIRVVRAAEAAERELDWCPTARAIGNTIRDALDALPTGADDA